MKVLIVDDSGFNRNVLKAKFSQHGHETVEAKDGQEGLEMAGAHMPDLIVSDILMPRMDGFRFLRNLKKDVALKSVPFVFYSVTYYGEREIELARSLGADGFIVRKKSPEEFWDDLEMILEKVKTKRQPALARQELIEEDEEFLMEYIEIVNAKLENKVEELQRAKEALSSTRIRLEHLLSYSPAAIFSCEPQPPYAVTFMSENVAALLGYTVQDFMETPGFLMDHIHPDDIRQTRRGMSALQKTGHCIFEYRFLHNDGAYRWLYVEMKTARDDAGNTVELVGSLMDITERKNAADRIVRLNRLYSVLSRANEAIVRIREARELFNEICRIIVEYGMFRMAWIGFVEPETLLVKPAAFYGHEDGYLSAIKISADDRIPEGSGLTGTAICNGNYRICNDIEHDPGMIPWREEAVKRGYRASGAFALKNKDVTIGTLNVYSSQAHTFQEEEVKLLVSLADDISFAIESMEAEKQRKETSEALRKSEEFSVSILESIDQGLIVIDPQFRIIQANSAYCEQMKSDVKDIVGRHCYEVAHHLDKPCFEAGEYCAVLHTFKTGISHMCIHNHIDKNGTPVYVESRSYPIIDGTGKVTAVIEITNDISEKRRLEEQLRHTQKMESIGTLVGGIAHDFNNMLSVIMGYGAMIETGMKKDDPHLPQIKEILAAAESAAQLTRGLLLFSRKQVTKMKLVNLNQLIVGFQKMLKRMIGEDIELGMTIPEEVLIIQADAAQMEQVLMNLAVNARDAMPDKGTITIEAKPVSINVEFIKKHGFGEPGRYALITVADTGCGISDEIRDKIFEPYFTTKGVGKGTGLGLSIVYGIVKQHGGYIEYDSVLGKGTAFSIYLPLSESDAAENQMAVLAAPKGGKETILLAEDEPSVRTLIRLMLENFGYKVIEAVNGEDAVIKFKENKDGINLLLLDVIMPRKNGRDAYEDIKGIRHDIKTIFLSGYAPELLRGRGLFKEDDLVFIPKPVMPYTLMTKVREVLDR